MQKYNLEDYALLSRLPASMATQAPMCKRPSTNVILKGDFGSWAQSLPRQSQLLQAQEKAKSVAASMAATKQCEDAHEQNDVQVSISYFFCHIINISSSLFVPVPAIVVTCRNHSTQKAGVHSNTVLADCLCCCSRRTHGEFACRN